MECRRGRRRKFQSRGGRGGGGKPRGGEGDRSEPRAAKPRPASEMHTTTCSKCEQETQVPFVPDGVRPVFCMPCLKQQTR